MHRIDGAAAAPGGLFTEGDPNVGTPATVVTDDWLNAVQEEIAGVVEASGATLAKPNNAQLLAAIKALVDLAQPAGAIEAFAFSPAPAGWSACDGGALSRTAEARLFAKIGTTYGAGDGSTTFNKPDLRGEVVRGWDAGRGVDADRALGSWQDWATGRPKSTTPSRINGDNTTSATLQHAGGSAISSPHPSAVGFARVSRTGESVTGSGHDSTNANVEIDTVNAVTGDSETRARNVALLYCIRL